MVLITGHLFSEHISSSKYLLDILSGGWQRWILEFQIKTVRNKIYSSSFLFKVDSSNKIIAQFSFYNQQWKCHLQGAEYHSDRSYYYSTYNKYFGGDHSILLEFSQFLDILWCIFIHKNQSFCLRLFADFQNHKKSKKNLLFHHFSNPFFWP